MSVRRRSIQARMRVELEQERGRHSFTKGILETFQALSKRAIEENTALKTKQEQLLKAANSVMKAYMPQFPDSRAVDDCLVELAVAITECEK